MIQIPSSVPVFIQNLEIDESKRYSKAKLKVFYIGTTGDKRIFTSDFSKKLIKSLPLTPVVGYYSEEKEDFVGHNSTQYVYGIVPDTATIEFVEEDGTTFAVTDVILFTEREDNISEVAKKIVGKQHSLELKPDSVKYKIHRDSFGNFTGIEFTEGEFIGLSVLGDDETPAFNDSEFFTTANFNEKIAECKIQFNNFLEFLNNNGGNIEVLNLNESLFKSFELTFKSMQDFQREIIDIFYSNGKCGHLVENTNDYAIFWELSEDKWIYNKYEITKNDDNKLSLSLIGEVVIHYVLKDDASFVDNSTAEQKQKEDKTKCEENVNEDKQKSEDPEEKDNFAAEGNEGAKTNQENTSAPEFTSAISKEETEDDEDKNKQKKEEEKPSFTATNSSSAALSNEERIELENYRHQHKINIIEDYRGELNDDILSNYIEKVDSYSIIDLETELALEYRKYSKQIQTKPTFIRQINPIQPIITAQSNYDENDPAAVILKHTKK